MERLRRERERDDALARMRDMAAERKDVQMVDVDLDGEAGGEDILYDADVLVRSPSKGYAPYYSATASSPRQRQQVVSGQPQRNGSSRPSSASPVSTANDDDAGNRWDTGYLSDQFRAALTDAKRRKKFGSWSIMRRRGSR